MRNIALVAIGLTALTFSCLAPSACAPRYYDHYDRYGYYGYRAAISNMTATAAASDDPYYSIGGTMTKSARYYRRY